MSPAFRGGMVLWHRNGRGLTLPWGSPGLRPQSSDTRTAADSAGGIVDQMVKGQLVSALGGLCIAGASAYAAYLLWGDWFPRSKREIWQRLKLVRRHELGRRALAWLESRGMLEPQPELQWLDAPLGTDPVAIGRHASLTEGYDEAHAARVADLARSLGEAAGLEEDVVASLFEAGHLHDAGIEDWDVDLTMSGPLPAEQAARLPEHVARSETLARQLSPDPLVSIWIRWHHERYDGTGYPDGLVADEIPLPAQILGLADTYEALTHRRPYREALDPQDALAELHRMAGIQFDPDLVALFAREIYPGLVKIHRASQAEPSPAHPVPVR